MWFVWTFEKGEKRGEVAQFHVIYFGWPLLTVDITWDNGAPFQKQVLLNQKQVLGPPTQCSIADQVSCRHRMSQEKQLQTTKQE